MYENNLAVSAKALLITSTSSPKYMPQNVQSNTVYERKQNLEIIQKPTTRKIATLWYTSPAEHYTAIPTRTTTTHSTEQSW